MSSSSYVVKTLNLSDGPAKGIHDGSLFVQRPYLIPTKVFSVFTSPAVSYEERHSKQPFVIEGGYSTCQEIACSRRMNQFGFGIFSDIVPDESLKNTRKVVKRFANHLISCYDDFHDEFSNIDTEEMQITRMPRIGKGKHNIHFDCDFSEEHAAVAKLAAEANFSKLLSSYMCSPCVLRETGISLTRPQLPPDGSSATNNTPGEGMQWHSDGARGEATVLLALEDVDEDMGCLRIVPTSHSVYVDGIGHEEDKLDIRQLAAQQVEYAYRAGEPIMFDARTLHSVAPNFSTKWRCVVWFIFDSY